MNKDFEEFGEQLTEEEKTAYTNAKTALDEAVKGDDAKVIQEAIPKLFEAANPLFAKKQEAEKAKAAEVEKNGETVDASFKEVDAEEKK